MLDAPTGPRNGMSDFYEEWAAETLFVANRVDPADRDPYDEAASELLSLARQAREASRPEFEKARDQEPGTKGKA